MDRVLVSSELNTSGGGTSKRRIRSRAAFVQCGQEAGIGSANNSFSHGLSIYQVSVVAFRRQVAGCRAPYSMAKVRPVTPATFQAPRSNNGR